jgi:GTP cyclohydrolase II
MTWNKILGTVSAQDTITLNDKSAASYNVNLPSSFPFNKAQFTVQALAMLSQLNDFDAMMVAKEIIQISEQPNSPSAIRHSLNPFRRIRRTKYPFKNYHYLITYSINDSNITINDIIFDRQLHGAKDRHAVERTMLYEVPRTGTAKYDKAMKREKLDELQTAWSRDPKPTTQVRTEHAAVNGMQNELTKATWLMGTHLDAAYQNDNIQAYTLFHNPTDKFALDVVECAFDRKKGNTSHNAQHLAAVLAQNQQQGKKVKWLVHSQGAIIFCSALQHFRRQYSGQLTTQQVAIHGTGAELTLLQSMAKGVGIHVNSVRNNPFDPVPNFGGKVERSKSSFIRACRFLNNVAGGDVGASPHTLPFLGLKTYAKQLEMLGYRDKSAEVLKFMRTLPKGDPRL